MSLNVSSWHNSASSAVSRALCNPWIDRSVALVAVVPFAYTLGHDISRFGFNIAWLVANANFVMLVLAMVIRRPPTRVTPNPAYWLLAFVATYWVFLVDHFVTPGPAAVPDFVIFALSFASFAVSVWARASLGRSIGLLPAQRRLVSRGAYRYMRHPIYTGVFFAYLAMTLARFSPVNAALFAAGAGLFVIKSFVEEEFLRKDPEYAAYMTAVRWRWFPFIA